MGCRGKAPQLFNPFISKHCLRLYAFGINAFRRIYCANYRLLFLGSLFVEFHSTPRKKLSFLTSNPKLTPSEVKTKQNASSSRRVEHTAGSVRANTTLKCAVYSLFQPPIWHFKPLSSATDNKYSMRSCVGGSIPFKA